MWCCVSEPPGRHQSDPYCAQSVVAALRKWVRKRVGVSRTWSYKYALLATTSLIHIVPLLIGALPNMAPLMDSGTRCCNSELLTVTSLVHGVLHLGSGYSRRGPQMGWGCLEHSAAHQYHQLHPPTRLHCPSLPCMAHLTLHI